jgi:hypothetical protein
MNDTKMNPEIKTRWVEALRSGSYKQLTGALHLDSSSGSAFCCLGVLCDLAIQDGILPGWDRFVDFPDDEEPEEWNDEFLPGQVQTWAGLGTANPAVQEPEYPGDEVTLAACNDERNLSFPQIADLIETQL